MSDEPVYQPLLRGPRAALRRLGRALGRAAQPGDVLALSGPLGAGKTFLTGALAQGLGVPREQRITSPTFMLVQSHQGRLALHHADLYRLGSVAELDALGLLESSTDGLLVLEWPERFAAVLPEATLWLRLERVSPLQRAVSVAGPVAVRERLLAEVLAGPALRYAPG